MLASYCRKDEKSQITSCDTKQHCTRQWTVFDWTFERLIISFKFFPISICVDKMREGGGQNRFVFVHAQGIPSSKKISTCKRESEFFGDFLGSLWEVCGMEGWGVLICEFFGNILGILSEFFGNSLRILNCIPTQSCECDMNWCNFWQGETRTRTGQDRTTNQILRSSLARSHLKSPILILYC